MVEKKKTKRIYHHYMKLEEYHAGMWRIVSGPEREDFKLKAANLMKDVDAFYGAMKNVVFGWKHSCEANLSAKSINRRAWLGHAGCCSETGSPEDVTRLAWHTLTQEQQDKANEAADRAIALWEEIQLIKEEGNQDA